LVPAAEGLTGSGTHKNVAQNIKFVLFNYRFKCVHQIEKMQYENLPFGLAIRWQTAASDGIAAAASFAWPPGTGSVEGWTTAAAAEAASKI